MKNAFRDRHLFVIVAAVLFGLASAGVAATSPQAGLDAGEVYAAVDNPRDGDLVTGIVWIRGWVLRPGLGDVPAARVAAIELRVNGGEISHYADLHLPRPDLDELFPDHIGGPLPDPGFSIMFSTRSFANGSILTVGLRVTFEDGSWEDIDPITVTVDHSRNQAPFGHLDSPRQGESVQGAFPVVGWALDGDGLIDKVEVQIGSRIKYGAVMGDYRPDVANSLAELIPGADGAGFIIWVDSNDLDDGINLISVLATDNEGMTRTFGPVQVQSYNNPSNQPPFGRIDEPIYNAEWVCTQCAQTPQCPVSPCAPAFARLEDVYFVSGWALDTDNTAEPEKEGGVAYVELLFDGALIWNTDRDCTILGTLFDDVPAELDSLWVNCYGLFRPDVNMMFPGFAFSKDAGFLFAVDVCAMFLFNGYTPGVHILTIRAGDIDEAVSNIDQLPVLLTCPANVGDYPAIGYIDYPYKYEYVNGVIPYTGWTMDRDGVSLIEIWVDGTIVGYATWGYERPDVPDQYPNYPADMANHSGFLFHLDTTLLSDGEHDTYVRVIDNQGEDTILGQRRIVVDNGSPW